MKTNISLTVLFLLGAISKLFAQPVAVADSLTIPEDTPGVINVLLNDTGTQISVLAVDTNTFGTIGAIAIVPDSSISYIPPGNFFGEDSFLYVIEDNAMQKDTAQVNVIVTPVNDPPLLSPIPDTTMDESTTLDLPVTASDPDGDMITLTTLNLPAFGNFTDNGDGTGSFAFNPGFDDAGVYQNISVIATDNGAPNLADTVSFTLTVTNVNRPPVLDPIPDQSMNEGETLEVAVSATDPDGNAITLFLIAAPSFATLTDSGNGAGTIRFTPGYNHEGAYIIQVLALDNGSPALSSTITFNLTVNNKNRPPVLTSISNQAIAEGEMLNVAITADDPDEDNLTLIPENLPPFASFTDNGDGSGTIRFTPGFGHAGTYPGITIIARDDGIPQLSDTTIFELTVSNTNRPPVINSIPDQVMNEGAILVVSVSVTDPDGNTITLLFSNLPSFATAVDSGNGKGSIRFTPGFNHANVYPNITVVAQDNGTPQLFATRIFNLTVNNVNRAPVLSAISDKFMAEGDTLNAAVSAFDPDGDNITLSPLNLPAFASFTNTGNGAGNIRFTPVPGNSGNFPNIVVFAIDNGVPNLSDSVTFRLKVLKTPSINNIVVSEVIYNQNLTITAQVVADTTVQSVSLRYAKSQQGSEFFSGSMLPVSGSTYRATVPGAFIDEQALKFFIEVIDNFGLRNAPDTLFKSVGVPPGALARTLPKDQWLMFSLPFNSSNKSIGAILNSLGPESDTRWKIFRTRPSGVGRECYNSGDLNGMGEYGRFEPGNAFWLYLKEVDSQQLSFPQMETIQGDLSVTDTLQVGWNQIGNPYAFPISWIENVENTAGLQPFRFDGAGLVSDQMDTSDFELYPWNGYAVFNDTTFKVAIRYFPQGKPGAPRPLPKLNPQSDWKILLTARTANRYAKTVAGMAAQALPEKDPLDYVAPPVMGEDFVSMFFHHPDWDSRVADFSSDFRPHHNDGATWQLTIVSSTRSVKLRPEWLEKLPENFRAAFYDSKYGTTWPLEAGSEITLLEILPQEENRFTLLIGTEPYISGELGKIDLLLPREFRLLQNYPNPFNPETFIAYQLPEAGRVTLAIYNLLGQLVKTLVDEHQEAGFYKVRWDGANNAGAQTASGVYFYRIRSGKHTRALKMLKIQ